MSYPQTATSDPYAFSLWSDASAASEETTMLAQAAGCAQPGLAEGLFFDDLLDTTLAWEQIGATPAETFGIQYDINWTTGGVVAADMPVPLPSATMNTTMTFAPTTTPLANNMDAYAQGFFFVLLWNHSDGTRNGFPPFPIFDTTSLYFPQPSLAGPPFPQLDIAGVWDPNQITGAPPVFFMGRNNFVGQVQSGILDPMNTGTYTNLTSSTQLDYT
ncbi:hypothetical protein EDB89DRAFT_2069441 [Lactarius sanguifluus]|nr:hypothetical protein EDB89DRAFT_2069441 [Lactarius sanguifluus]